MTDSSLPIDETRQQLHEVLRQGESFDEKAHEALELAAECFDADNGYLARIDQDTDYWETIVTTDTPDGLTPPDLELDLHETYCRETIEDNTPTTIYDASSQDWADDPAFKTREHNTYIGIPLIVDEEPYGTACLVAEEPRSEPFSETEIQFFEHLARLLERELERDQLESQLTMQSNFATVLNRVLRHNLRNDISVVRGYTNAIADQLDDNDGTFETVLDHIDGLIELSEKARDLEEIITASSDRRRTEVGTLLTDISEHIGDQHPEASITVECDNEIHLDVLQNFNRVIEELIENAVEHGNDNPTITVTAEQRQNVVEFQIIDDGPGIPDAELEVLEKGEETPLMHGSGMGLWMVNWIIENHDGSLKPEVTENGTTLTITIPRKAPVSVQENLTDLSRSRDKFKATFEESSDAMVIVNDEGRIIEANHATESVYGLGSNEVIGRSLHEFLPDEFDFATEWEAFKQAGRQNDTITIHTPDGNDRIIEYSAVARIVPNQHLFISREITERYNQKQELSQLKQRYETLLETAPDPIFVADAETEEIIQVNDAAETLIGESRNQLIGRHITSFHPSGEEELYSQTFRDAIGKETTLHTLPDGSTPQIATSDGGTIPVEFNIDSVSLPDKTAIFGIVRDKTEQVQQERELKETTQQLQLALKGSDTGVWEWDIETDEVRWTESLERLVGLESDSFEGTFEAFQRYLHPEDRKQVQTDIEQALKTESQFKSEFRLQREDGTEMWIESRAEIIDNTDDSKRMVGIVTEITERKEREAELKKKTEAIEKAPIGIILTDPSQSDNPLVYANEKYCKMSGYEESEMLGQNCRFMQGPETDPETTSKIRTAIDNEETISTVIRNYRKDGTQFWNELEIAPIRNENGELQNFVGFQKDVTDRIEREKRLKLAEIMFENTQDALFIIDVAEDEKFHIDRVNAVYEELTGLSNEEITGKTPTEVVGDEIGREIELQYRECVERQETIKYPEQIPVDGEQRQWETKVTPVINDGCVEKLVGAMRDVTTI